MSDSELDGIEKRAKDRFYAAAFQDVMELVAEVRRLRRQIEGHCARIAAQSELLTKKAMREKNPENLTERADFFC